MNLFLKEDFSDFFLLERKTWREKDRERKTCQLSLTYTQPGTWPTSQAFALAGNEASEIFSLQYDVQPTEPQQSGLTTYLASCFLDTRDGSGASSVKTGKIIRGVLTNCIHLEAGNPFGLKGTGRILMPTFSVPWEKPLPFGGDDL